MRLLGIGDFLDNNGYKVYTQHHFFFDFIRENSDHFNINPSNIKIIQKIFEFCNHSVHKGVMPFVWQMHYAILFCEALFLDSDRTIRTSWNIHSAIRITGYDGLKKKLSDQLVAMFPSPKYDLSILWIKPEAEIISE
jgi:hypothetical protein